MKRLNLDSPRLKGLNLRQKKGFLKYRKSIYSLPPFDEKRYAKLIEEVFITDDFMRQLEEVKLKLPHHDPELIEDVIKFQIREIAKQIQKIRPWKRRIYIPRWAYIEVFPLCYNAYSLYYHHDETMKLLKKYEKEISKIDLIKNFKRNEQ